ncbi:hypothetical protein, partial [Ruminococcus sp.]|uniref:hypothetical protein n=1 Tax=Ruminococcus sp. TaxID=41978 RepID=UPI00258BF846
MKDINNRNKHKRITRFHKRLISMILVFVMTLENIPLFDIGLKNSWPFSTYSKIKTFAAEGGTEYDIDSVGKLVAYSQNYDSSHVNDTLKITFGDGATSGAFTGYKSIGASEDKAFKGHIIIDSGMTLNLPESMFGYITDDVKIVGTNGEPALLTITRTAVTSDEPLFAKHVIHQDGSEGNEWKLHYDRFENPETNTYYVYDFAGFIGTIEEEAIVNISELIYDNLGTATSTPSKISSPGNAGLVCGTIAAKGSLTVGSISQTSDKGSDSYSVSSTSSGHAGGLVGGMEDGAKLTLGTDVENPQADNQGITASSGYAGGIVG